MTGLLDDDALARLRAAPGRHAWLGREGPDGTEAMDVSGLPGFRPTAHLHRAFDTVWLVEAPLAIQGWRILLDSAIRLLRPQGVLVVRYVQNPYVSVINLKNFLFRRLDLEVEVEHETTRLPEFLTVFRIRRQIGVDARSWTFGVLTQGTKPALVERFCRTIREFGGGAHQILITGPQDVSYAPYGPEYVETTYSSQRAEICRKKNDIVALAGHENVCIVHDRYWLNDDFFTGFEAYGYDFDFLTVRQHHQSGKIHPAYCAIDDRAHLLWGPISHCLNESETWVRHYLNGGLIIGKRTLLRRVPFNDLLFHNQGEDVELSREMSAHSVVARINNHSSMTTDVADHLTDVFTPAAHTDYDRLFAAPPRPLPRLAAVPLPPVPVPLPLPPPSPPAPPPPPSLIAQTIMVPLRTGRLGRALDVADRFYDRRRAGASWGGLGLLGVGGIIRAARPHREAQVPAPVPEEVRPRREDVVPSAIRPPLAQGANLLLHASDAGGVLNVTVHYARKLLREGIPVCLVDIGRWPAPIALPDDLAALIVGQPRYPTNIWCLGFPFLQQQRDNWPDFFEQRWNISFTHWELPHVPQRLAGSFDLVDSVVVASSFVQDAIAEVTSRPVELIDPEVRFPAVFGTPYDRFAFGLPPDKILFLLNWEFTSSTRRKNPEAAIEAFEGAFGTMPDAAAMVVHVKLDGRHGAEWEDALGLFRQELRRRHPHLLLIPENTLTYEQTIGLKRACDCYVSLHRSEGYGMSCAEALAVGRRCIMTAWSGNLALCETPGWSERIYGIAADLVPVTAADYPWVAAGEESFQHWAEPAVDAAIRSFRQACEDIRAETSSDPRPARRASS